MRKKVRRIFCVLEKKKKGGELTKGGTGPSSSGPLPSTVIRHPLPSDGTVTGGGYETGTSSSSNGTSSSGRTVTGGPCRTSSSSGTAIGGVL
jgi:hypothetical protein